MRIATATGVSLAERGRVALHDARRGLHLGIGVDDDEPAHVVARDEVDDALVGQLRHDEVGERAQRRVGLERARELLADRGQQAERAAAAALGVVHARALERVRALLAERDRERALVVVEDVAALEAEAERAERAVARAQRHRRGGRSAAAAVGEAPLALALVEEDGRPLSMASPIGVRRESGKRRQPATSSSNPKVATSSTAVPSSTGSATMPPSAPSSSRPSPSATS